MLADSFSASDTPSLKEFDGRPVAGAYIVDDEGVRPKDVTLVEKGRLVTLLTSRTPQKNLLQSNGHGRGGSVQAGVFQVQSAQAVPARRAEGEVSGRCSRRRTRRSATSCARVPRPASAPAAARAARSSSKR